METSYFCKISSTHNQPALGPYHIEIIRQDYELIKIKFIVGVDGLDVIKNESAR